MLCTYFNTKNQKSCPLKKKKKTLKVSYLQPGWMKNIFVKIRALNCLTAVFNKWKRAKTSRLNLFTIWSAYLVGIVCNISYQHKSKTACTYPKSTEPGLYWIIRTNFLIYSIFIRHYVTVNKPVTSLYIFITSWRKLTSIPQALCFKDF